MPKPRTMTRMLIAVTAVALLIPGLVLLEWNADRSIDASVSKLLDSQASEADFMRLAEEKGWTVERTLQPPNLADPIVLRVRFRRNYGVIHSHMLLDAYFDREGRMSSYDFERVDPAF